MNNGTNTGSFYLSLFLGSHPNTLIDIFHVWLSHEVIVELVVFSPAYLQQLDSVVNESCRTVNEVKSNLDGEHENSQKQGIIFFSKNVLPNCSSSGDQWCCGCVFAPRHWALARRTDPDECKRNPEHNGELGQTHGPR